MSLSEHLSTIFPNKSKSSGDHRDIDDNQERGPTNSPFDLIEHDVSGLSVLSSLPKPDSFDALQIGSDRLRTIIAALQCNIIVRKEDLVRNLDYVANVLETVHQDET
ncbi:unnamed protein product, partial [Rotaria magnacalcarata]